MRVSLFRPVVSLKAVQFRADRGIDLGLVYGERIGDELGRW